MGLWYLKDSGFELIAFSDADHARCIDTFKITSRRIQFLGDKLVSWMSKSRTALQCHQQRLSTWRYLTPVPSTSILDIISSRNGLKMYLVRRIGMRCLTPAELEVLTHESA
ncbi:hypothetical protein Tco_0030245 [Tanacetum coccineum]